MKKLLEAVFQSSDDILRGMRGQRAEWRYFAQLSHYLRIAFLPEVLLLFVSAIALAALLIGIVFAVHVLISLARKRQTRVFISFQHEREPIADALADEMTKCGIRAEKLPFVESADSDTLLDQVKQEIRDCDIFVCVPGNRPSFVEYEVSMAFMVEKPLLFVFIEADASHLPNTAKKGCPVFALEGLQREGFRTLANFCSYLAADWRSTTRLYKAVFNHLLACGGLVVAVYLLLVVMLTNVMSSSERPDITNPSKLTDAQIAQRAKEGTRLLMEANKQHRRIEVPNIKESPSPVDQGHTINEHKSDPLLGSPQTAVSNPAILWFFGPSLILFLVPYGLFFITRLTLRAKLRRVISRRKFRDTFIPETLAYSLTRVDLLKILYQGDIVAHHESDRADAKSP